MGNTRNQFSGKFDPEWATTRQVAIHFGVTSRTVLNWFHAGEISAELAVGRTFRFSIPKLDEALRQHPSTRQTEGTAR